MYESKSESESRSETAPEVEPEIKRGLVAIGRELDQTPEPLDGRAVRSSASTIGRVDADTGGRRAVFLAVAAAIVVIVGVVGAVTVGGGSREVTSAASSSEDPPEQDEPGTAIEDTAEDTADVTPSTIAPLENNLPQVVTAAEIGPVAARYLPPVERGLEVTSVAQILASELQPEPAPAEPIDWQRDSLITTDPADRRSVQLSVSIFASEGEATAFVEHEPLLSGGGGEEINVAGRQGRWIAEPGSAPFSAGDPEYSIGMARVRLSETMVLDVAAPDGSKAEVEALIAGAVVDQEGHVTYPVVPEGFESANSTVGLGANLLAFAGTPIDYIDLVLTDGSQRPLAVIVVAERGGLLDSTNATFETDDGYGWTQRGLFRELQVTWVSGDVVINIADYHDAWTEEELIGLAAEFELVDDEQVWIDRLSEAGVTRNPIWWK